MEEIKIEIVKIFFLNLAINIKNTYLYSYTNADLMDENDKIEHFNWCFNETVKQYAPATVFFKKNNELLTYSYSFFKNLIYECPQKRQPLIELIDSVKYAFNNHKSKKNLSELEVVFFENLKF